MKVLFRDPFDKDLKKIKDQKILLTIKSYIIKLEKNTELKNISNVSKLKGYKNYYRIRIGNYRLGFKMVDNFTIWLIRFLKREDIYKKFP